MRTTGGKLVALLLLVGLGVGGYFAWKSVVVTPSPASLLFQGTDTGRSPAASALAFDS